VTIYDDRLLQSAPPPDGSTAIANVVGSSSEEAAALARAILDLLPVMVYEVKGEPAQLLAGQSAPRHDVSPRGIVEATVALIDSVLRRDERALRRARQVAATSVYTDPPLSNVQIAAAYDLFYEHLLVPSGAQALAAKDFVQSRAVPDHLPAIDDLLGRFGSVALDYDTVQVIACQHLLGSTVRQIELLQQVIPGAEFLEISGKPYSVNRAASSALAQAGFNLNNASLVLPEGSSHLLGSFASYHKQVVQASIERVLDRLRSVDGPLIVIDDGGALTDAIGRALVDHQIRRPVVAIEQTTHGLYGVRPLLSDKWLQRHGFAIVNVAQSYTKLYQESALVAESVVYEMLSWLKMVPDQPSRLRSIGILGFGAVGDHIRRVLRRAELKQRLEESGLSQNLLVFDRSRSKSALAESQGIPTARSAAQLAQESDIIIGATGGVSVNRDTAGHLRSGTILVSASSGDLEFRGLNDWSLSRIPLLPESDVTSPFERAHGLIRAEFDDGRLVHVVNSGFPVNFDGSADPIAVNKIQLTRALMVGGVLQGLGARDLKTPRALGTSGEHYLADEIDEYLSKWLQRAAYE
jgi:hypothetical protein